MNAAVKLMQEFKDRDARHKLRGYQDKVELIRKRNLGSWDDQPSTLSINDQYIQNKRSSWTPVTVMAYYIRKILRPIFRLSQN